MNRAVGGYKKSSGTLGIQAFKASGNLVKLASVASSNEYKIQEFTPISDQESLSSCVANATADALEILKGLENANSVTQLSRLFIYWNARLYTKETDKDDGCFIHDALDSLVKLGVCQETTWPYEYAQVYAQPPISAYREGNDNTINTFYQITSDNDQRLNDIELAVRANHPVIFGTAVGQELVDYRGADIVFNPPQKALGGHALIVTGVRTNTQGQREFYIRNSWGTGFGINGHCWFSSDYMAWAQTGDLFVPTKMDNLLL